MSGVSVALVTGSSRGIGKGIAEHFLRQGYKVAGCSRGPSSTQNNDYVHSLVDVGDDRQVREWVKSVENSFGKIDVVVNNAGLYQASHVLLTPTDTVESTLRTNFLGPFTVCRESARTMMKQKIGRIINISSIAVTLSSEGTSAYTASKCALIGFSKVLAKELSSFGITCNVVDLSIAETDISTGLSEEIIEHVMKNLTIKRYATIEDICNAVSFFASPSSGYITGQVLRLGFVEPSL